MNLTLKVTKKEGTNMSSFLKLMCSLKCQIKVDSKNGDISIVGMDDKDTDKVIEVINEAFVITDMDMDSTDVSTNSNEPIITEDTIEFKKVEFSNEKIQREINNLLKKGYDAMNFGSAKLDDICKWLSSTGREIEMRYNPLKPIKLTVGDIVECDYGANLNYENYGQHHAIICDIKDDRVVYAVPIKHMIEFGSDEYLKCLADVDVKYNYSGFIGGTALLKGGGYINRRRVKSVIGHALPEFFEKVLRKLPTVFDFTEKYLTCNTAETAGESPTNEPEDNGAKEPIAEEAISETTGGDSIKEPENNGAKEPTTEATIPQTAGENPAKESKSKGTKMTAEDYLTSVIADALDALDKTIPEYEQVDKFLKAIDFSTCDDIFRQSLFAACHVKKIGYESIILWIRDNGYPDIKEEKIKATLIKEFKKWLSQHPDVKEKYPKMPIIVLLKIFARKMA